MFTSALALLFLEKQFLKINFYGFVIIFTIFKLSSKTLRNAISLTLLRLRKIENLPTIN